MAKAKKRADGRYCAQIYLGRDENGRKKYKSIYAKSPAELKEKETAIRLQLGQGIDLLSQRDSFNQWADDWLRLKETEGITARRWTTTVTPSRSGKRNCRATRSGRYAPTILSAC